MSEVAQALGQQLKAEREKRGMSAQKMADDMHLDAWVIEALEAGDYQRIGPTVYAKGHLKKYADLLGVSAVDSSAARIPNSRPSGHRSRSSAWIRPAPRAVCRAVCSRGRGGRGLVGGGVWLRPWHAASARRRLRLPTRGRPPRVKPRVEPR